MQLIPAIDLKNGQCVRLRQGRMEEVTVFSDDPVAVATRWAEAGAERLHIVDLDGAQRGKPVNTAHIRRIAAAFPGLTLQAGGGIRDEATVDAYLNAGVRYVIIGTKAVKNPRFVTDLCAEFPGHILVALDARDGKAAVEGWSKLSHHDVIDLARQFEQDGVEAIIYTDISRDGMMQGVNVEATARLARSIQIPVIASGGIASYDDLLRLQAVEGDGVVGAIIGRALYDGVVDLAEARRRLGG